MKKLLIFALALLTLTSCQNKENVERGESTELMTDISDGSENKPTPDTDNTNEKDDESGSNSLLDLLLPHYFKDTYEESNVLTMGNVEITQLELKRDGDKLVKFDVNDLSVFPAIMREYSFIDINGNPIPDENAKTSPLRFLNAFNIVDRIVAVKNHGDNAAYVRTIFAFEVAESTDEIGSIIHIVKNDTLENPKAKWTWEWQDEVTELNGTKYAIAVATYNTSLETGKITDPSLLQFYLDTAVTTEDIVNYGNTYDMRILSQAVQSTGGFEDRTPAEALELAFSNDYAEALGSFFEPAENNK